MNFLAHLYLSGDDPALMAGNLAGDFVKGRLDGGFPDDIRRGLLLHRRIDSFAHRNDCFVRSRNRLDPAYGLYRGVLVDLFYDHFLAKGWGEWSAEPYPRFLDRARRAVAEHAKGLPEGFLRVVPVIFDELLPSYHEEVGIARALGRMAARINRPNPLAGGVGELVRHYAVLEADFRSFLCEAEEYVQEFLSIS